MVNKPLIRPYFLGGVARIPLNLAWPQNIPKQPIQDFALTITASISPCHVKICVEYPFLTHKIHIWYIYLHLVNLYGKLVISRYLNIP